MSITDTVVAVFDLLITHIALQTAVAILKTAKERREWATGFLILGLTIAMNAFAVLAIFD